MAVVLQNKFNFQKLTPTQNADLNIYEDALDFIFKQDDLKNIAITGPYSAGKSSILETYKNKRSDKRLLNISLAHFEDSVSFELLNEEESKKSNFESKDNIVNDKSLEGKILNQLIHQINPDKIPQTQFKTKRKISLLKMWGIASLVTLFLLLATYVLRVNNWRHFVKNLSNKELKTILTWSTNDSFVVISGIFCIVMSTYLIFELIRLFQYKRVLFKKLKVQGNEIEIFEQTDQSYFDKYLNEVLYLFENADVDVFVFEDMDRFNSNQIFGKLREINYLINKKSTRIIRFFYLLRDDIFTSKDRTKFFDFIVPIVPIVDGSNSYDQFIDHLKKGGIFEDFDKNFLQELSLYIDDMRLLKNIYNEYVIYHGRIQSTELDCNKLLAIISYKNIFPKDFSELQLGRGFIHSLFSNKSAFVSDELQKINVQTSRPPK
ncbi:hypothetical protein [Paenibacillus macerans]|uniref:YobI family P-loop NTPase n=1 Tax=Paenibacillus macerans TaxID=44252 RepID=UPI003D31664C